MILHIATNKRHIQVDFLTQYALYDDELFICITFLVLIHALYLHLFLLSSPFPEHKDRATGVICWQMQCLLLSLG